MLIREMECDDLAKIEILESQLFTSQWSRDDFIYEIKKNEVSYNYVLEEESEIVGYVGVWIMYDQAQITTIGVRSDCQRKGYGRYMMTQMINLVKKHGCLSMSLEVRVSNSPAISLYESLGFQNVAIRKNYYQDNHEDAYLMIKEWECEQ